jgi:DNA polymerase epsilon subunit 1
MGVSRHQADVGGGGGGGGYQRSAANKEQFIKDKRAEAALLDTKFGYEMHEEGPPRLGWLFNMCPTVVEEGGVELSAVELYFLQQDASTFKARYIYMPYFYVGLSDSRFCTDVANLLSRRFSDQRMVVEMADKEDLDLANHLAGHQQRYLKLKFNNVGDLMEVRKQLMPMIEENQSKLQKVGAYQGEASGDATGAGGDGSATGATGGSSMGFMGGRSRTKDQVSLVVLSPP